MIKDQSTIGSIMTIIDYTEASFEAKLFRYENLNLEYSPYSELPSIQQYI